MAELMNRNDRNEGGFSEEQSDDGQLNIVTVPDMNPNQQVNKNDEAAEKVYDLSKMSDILLLVKEKDEEKIKKFVKEYIYKILIESGVTEKHVCIFLFDEDNSISRGHAERIYDSIQSVSKKKDIILFLRSKGGRPEPAYLISKLCNRFKKDKFIVSIPAEAKSAATLLSFGADEIHMGPMSELGPIDMQVDGLPLLSVSSALRKIASIVEEFPGSSGMFSDYLTQNLNIGLIGYYDRVTESAIQYASILLGDKHASDTSRSVDDIANRFTTHYKDHGFVIDAKESQDILGEYIVKDNSKIYSLGSKILSLINQIEFAFILSGVKKKIILVGDGCDIGLCDASKDNALFKGLKISI
ncbi:TPA: hypothetical protein SMV28_003699 [Proteus mirabilis]|uniref:SDH family Clp fold serine proteinase n=3 Tax=Proteus mirabilis TaxID=584 RepID=UPI0029E710E2|nr:hypothetical protein [Proteus mirabilis]HEK0979880.1 hypothetical protein [Proteus mirabilis]HEK1091639.1 hypothetical protein [Proteus mirabilis]HEK1885576.1 hypothetical protein [Proteus mirabilis]HEK1906421.1 hypothetical protein [Proteus mirabilis]